MSNRHLSALGYQFDSDTGVWAKPGFSGISYSDGDQIEADLEKGIDACTDRSVGSSELVALQTSWATKYHLSSIRSHLFKPVEHLLRGKSVLEIGAGCGAVTRHLGELGCNVLAVEGSPRRARICRKRTHGLEMVTVVNDRFADVTLGQKFDVVTLIGVLEYAAMFTSGEEPHLAMLHQATNHLKPGGVLLVAIENRLGLKYFTGALEDHMGEAFYGIEDRYQDGQPKTFGYSELATLFSRAGMKYLQTLAPFPDYKLPTVVITESGFRHPAFNAAALISPTESSDEQSPRLPVFSQAQTWPSILKNGLGMAMANSFFVVASDQPQPIDEQVLAYHFSSNRTGRTAKHSIFKANADTDSISVLASETTAQSLDEINPNPKPYHIDSYPLIDEIHKTLASARSDLFDVVNFFLRYREIVCSLAGIESGPGVVLPKNYLDAIPQNIMVQRDRYHLIDLEWTIEEPLVFDRLLYRSIIYSLNNCRLIRLQNKDGKRTLQEVVQKVFQDLGENSSPLHLDLLADAENTFQLRINPLADTTHWARNKNAPVRKPDVLLHHESLQCTYEIALRTFSDKEDHLKRILAAVQQHNSELEQALKSIKNSTSWKVTEPLRRLFERR